MTVAEVTRPATGARFRAMATDVTLQVVRPGATAQAALGRAEQVFHRVERACTRFVPDSPLMVANATPRGWHEVPEECFAAVSEAARAHLQTDGRFDPRVLRTLQAYGYDRSLAFRSGDVAVDAGPHQPTRARGTWRPGLDAARGAVRIGRDPIDLGGIGKGLAVRWAAAELVGAGAGFLVEAGGDCLAHGVAPDGDGWRIGVEDPAGGSTPLGRPRRHRRRGRDVVHPPAPVDGRGPRRPPPHRPTHR